MKSRKLLAALSALACVGAFAQASLGIVSRVEGVVTATVGSSGVTVTPGTAVRDGMRFVSTSRGSTTLRMNNGCLVTVPPGHGVTIQQGMDCQQLASAVQPIVPVTTPAGGAAVAATTSAPIGGTGIALIGAALAAIVIEDSKPDDPVGLALPPLSPQ